VSRFPRTLRLLGTLRDSYRLQRVIPYQRMFQKVVDVIAKRIERASIAPSCLFNGAVGQYLFETSEGGEHAVCIDTWDSGEIPSQELLERSDLYFKTNFWGSKSYPEKVIPIVNGNPLVLNDIPKLCSLRNVKKEYDLCLIVRVYTRTSGDEVVEHNLRILEEVSKVDCRKFILAYLTEDKVDSVARRLDEKNIPWVKNPMPIGELWRISSQSWLNIIRLGIYYCVPWRMIDLLAMGACPVLDRSPFTIWPEPLLEMRHFLSLNIAIGPGRWIAPPEDYARIPATIEQWLKDLKALDEISKCNSHYFDDHAEPQKVGEYIVKKVREKLSRNVG